MNLMIIQAIRNAFALDEETKLDTLRHNKDVVAIEQLPQLLELLLSEQSSPKLIAQYLELTVVNIKIKSKPTDLETKFLERINELVYKPMYEEEPEAEEEGMRLSPK